MSRRRAGVRHVACSRRTRLHITIGIFPMPKVFLSGTLAAAAVTLVASIASRRATGAYASALNAASHFLWGDRAARRHAYSWKYTGIGFAANYGASVFWALFYEFSAAASAAAPSTRYATARSSLLSLTSSTITSCRSVLRLVSSFACRAGRSPVSTPRWPSVSRSEMSIAAPAPSLNLTAHANFVIQVLVIRISPHCCVL